MDGAGMGGAGANNSSDFVRKLYKYESLPMLPPFQADPILQNARRPILLLCCSLG